MISFPLIGNVNINSSITNSLKEHCLPHALLIEADEGNISEISVTADEKIQILCR